MDFEGTVYRILPVVKGQGARGEWTKQEVVFELPGEFSRKVCVSFWGDKAQDAAGLREGEQVNVQINLESREHNGRWFTEARAWRITRKGAGDAPQYAGEGGYQSAPSFGATPVPAAVATSAPGMPPMPSKADEVDDLPF
jgi:hypothetical protein